MINNLSSSTFQYLIFEEINSFYNIYKHWKIYMSEKLRKINECHYYFLLFLFYVMILCNDM